MALFDWRAHFLPFIDFLQQTGHEPWAERLTRQLIARFQDNPHGDLPRWQSALDLLTEVPGVAADRNCSAIT
ncbi:hypothetical protein, partial [Escherichia coli]|uniref:hypothetical protein n=1 Tax=Escherichia coli TaxID=562 RepID=UPI0028DE81F2